MRLGLERLTVMLCLASVVVTTLGVNEALGQTPPPATASTSGADVSAPEDAGASTELPVSLDKIRSGLSSPPVQPLLGRLNERPTFTIAIEERQKFEELVARALKVEPVYVPPGGLYGYEQQRLAFNPTDHPLMQPYAAFNGAQLVTIAVENLLAKYLGGKLLNTLTESQRARAEAEARAEVALAITRYCAEQADGGSSLVMCHQPQVTGDNPEHAR